MGATYTRQSSYSDGDTITAAHTNDEFNQLLAAFAVSSGHTHDGTTAEGGPITKLLGTSITIGDGTSGTDLTITFDGETSDGVLMWMEDEDHFKFMDDVLVNSTQKLYFYDEGGEYIYASADGQLDIVAGTEVQIAATTIDINGNVDISGTLTIGSAGISEAELEVLDGLTVSTTEVNILDGDTTATSTTVADADRVVMNDNGTMVQVAVTDLAAYFDDEITAMPNLTSVGTLTTLTVDNVIVNGTTIGHTSDTDLMTLTSGVVTVAGELDATTLDISGNADIDGTTNLDAVDIDGAVQIDATVTVGVDDTGYDVKFFGDTASAYMLWDTSADDLILAGAAGLVVPDGKLTLGSTAVTSTGAELNIVDGGTSATSTTVADADRVVMNDNGTMVQVAVTDLAAYFDDEITAMPNLVTTGTLNSGAISSGFGAIDIGSSALSTTGSVTLGATSFGDNDITNVGDIALDSISADGTDINIAVSDNSATALTIKQGSDAYLTIDTANSSESVAIGTGISGTAISIGHSTSETTVNDNLTVTGDLTVSGATTTVDTTNLAVKDTLLGLNQGAGSNSNDVGIIIERGSTGNDALFMWDESEDKFALGTTTDNASSTGNLNMTTGTLVANIEGTASTATVATTVTITDNESTDEDNAVIFTAGGDVDGGNLGLESDGNLTYNPSTGRLTATQLSGTLQTAAQANITSLGTLTTLTVDNVIINGSTIGHTGDTDLMTVASGVLTVAGEVDATSLDISGNADIDGTLEADAITVNGTALNTVIADESTALAIALG